MKTAEVKRGRYYETDEDMSGKTEIVKVLGHETFPSGERWHKVRFASDGAVMMCHANRLQRRVG